MQGGGIMPAGSGRALRLDPLALPVRFPASDAGADGRMRVVELHRERVVLRRCVRGMPMAVNLPVSAFLGVALRVIQSAEDAGETVCISLEHRDPALSIPLYAAAGSDDVVAEWQSWARALRMPLLIAEGDGILHAPFPYIGQVRSGPSAPRRRGRTSLKRRRSSIGAKRQTGRALSAAGIHRSEHEITTRD
jgi:hypothetical protein